MKFIFLFLFLFVNLFAKADAYCTNGFTEVLNKCLKIFPDTVTHKEAEKTCLKYGAILTTVKTAIDNRSLASFPVNSSFVSPFWIGLYCIDSDPSKCFWDDSDGSARLYNSFSSGYPKIGSGKCVQFTVQGSSAGQWMNGDCEQDKKPFVCELPVTSEDSCTYNYGRSCYTFHDPAPFAEAQSICEQECGNLLSISSANENRYINTLPIRETKGTLLLGAQLTDSNPFSWVGGAYWWFDDFDPSIKMLTCLGVSSGSNGVSGDWHSVDCNTPYNFVCKRKAGMKCSATPAPVTPIPDIQSNCNSTVLLAPGVLSSPKLFHSNQYCTYQLATLGSYDVLLQFSEFNIQKDVDTLLVYDGESSERPLLGSYSGSLNPFTVSSTGNSLFVVYKSSSGSGSFSANFISYSHF